MRQQLHTVTSQIHRKYSKISIQGFLIKPFPVSGDVRVPGVQTLLWKRLSGSLQRQMVPCRGKVALFPAAQTELAWQREKAKSESLSTPFKDLVRFILLTAVIICLNLQITNLHGSRVLDIMFIDVGVQASVEVFELREIPPPFLRDLMAIPPQVSFCALEQFTGRFAV